MLGKLHRVSLVSNSNLAVGLNKSVNALLSLCHRALSVLYFLDSIIDLVSYPPPQQYMRQLKAGKLVSVNVRERQLRA